MHALKFVLKKTQNLDLATDEYCLFFIILKKYLWLFLSVPIAL